MKKITTKKQIERMSKEQLIELLEQTAIERDLMRQSINEINVGDILVRSSIESLDKCKEVINTLIKQHQDFLVLRRKKISMDTMGMVG